VNFGRRSALPVYSAFEMSDGDIRTQSPRDYDRRRHLLNPQQPARISSPENEARENSPLPVVTPTSTSTSINWWPYPPWGQSTVSPTLSSSASSSFSPAPSPTPAVVISTVSPSSTTSSQASTLSVTPSQSPAAVIVASNSASALPPEGSLPSQSKLHTAGGLNATLLYLIPVFIVVGLALGLLSGLLGYRWYSRRLARKSGSDDGIYARGSSTFIPGPPYASMRDAGQGAEGMQEASLIPAGSPSKYTRHGAPQTTRSWLSTVPGAGSTRAVAPSQSRHLSGSPTRVRSRGRAVSPAPLDEANDSYNLSRYRSIRRSILGRLQRSSDRGTSGASRDPSRRTTTQTYMSPTSAYSGTHSGDSRAPSAVPPSTPPSHDANTEWQPGSGFRIVEETISNLPSHSTTVSPTVSGVPRRTSAWKSGDALRQAVDTHPGERWLAWTQSWTSSPPRTSEDIFTVIPSRRNTQEKKDVESLLRSPPQVNSGPLQSTLTFSPRGRPSRSGRHPDNRLGTRRPQSSTVAKPAAPPHAARGTSNSSSIEQGDGHGTAAMRYAARHAALTRVEEILAHSYSSREIVPPKSPNAFGAAPASLEDIAWAAGIEQRLTAAASEDKDGV
jgi:hypothetical protein